MDNKKRCNKCGKEKNVSKFYKKLTSYQPNCKKCQLKERIKFARTKEGVASILYTSHVKRSRRKQMTPPTYTKNELKEWLFSQKLFHKLYDNWKRLDYQTDYIPSIDRSNPHLPYTMSNIQLMSWIKNKKKGYFEKKYKVPVIQTTIDNFVVNEFESITDASIMTSIDRSDIGKCVSGKLFKAGGFKWKQKT